jgi:PAS domain-containing protein
MTRDEGARQLGHERTARTDVERLREEDRIRERISEFEETERKLRESEQRFRDIAYSAGEYIWESDVHGRYTLVTERIEGILGV